MNERIQELAYQAEELADKEVDQGSEFHPSFCRIFAKLIVRECMAQCTKVEEDDELSGVSDGALLCREEIKQYFGIRE